MEMWHLALTRDWEAAVAAGEYRISTRGATVDDVGFVHCSLPQQAPAVAARFYSDVSVPLAILVMDTDEVRAAGTDVRFDDVGNGESFPHIYGPMDPAWVHRVVPARMADGVLTIDAPDASPL